MKKNDSLWQSGKKAIPNPSIIAGPKQVHVIIGLGENREFWIENAYISLHDAKAALKKLRDAHADNSDISFLIDTTQLFARGTQIEVDTTTIQKAFRDFTRAMNKREDGGRGGKGGR